jgi:chitodextrinase
LTAQAQSATSVKLTWTDNSTSETGFKIERITGTGVFEEIAVVTANTSTYTHTGLQPSTSYTYRVFAYSDAGNSAFSNQAEIQTLPEAPSGLTAQAQSATSVILTWVYNSSGENNFKIERKTGVGIFEEIAVVTSTITTYTILGLQPSTGYTFRVSAVSTAGNYACSNESDVQTFSEGTTGLEVQTQSAASFNIYPNPSIGLVNIEFELKNETRCSVSVINILGAEQILCAPIMLAEGRHIITLDGFNNKTAKSSPGIYIVKIVLDEQVFLKKLILSAGE